MKIAAFDIGFVNMVYVVAEGERDNNHRFDIVHWEQCRVGGPSDPCEKLVAVLMDSLYAARDKFAGVEVVVIERQLVTKMVVLVHAIQAFFIVLSKLQLFQGTVVVQHGTRKNLCKPWLMAVGLAAADCGRATYHRYKARAVQDAGQALALTDPKWTDFFHSRPKRDDYADALLHAIWYLFVRPVKSK